MEKKVLKVSYGGNTYSIEGFETIKELTQFYRKNCHKKDDDRVIEVKRFLGRYLLSEYGIDLYRMGEWCSRERCSRFYSEVFNENFSIKRAVMAYNELQLAYIRKFVPRKG